MQKPVLLIVDDDRNTREGLRRALRHKYEVLLAERADKALSLAKNKGCDQVQIFKEDMAI